MKYFSTFGLISQIIFICISFVCGISVEKERFKEASAALSKEAAENTRSILNAHKSPHLMELDHLVNGVETLMIYLNKNDPENPHGLKYLKQESINVMEIMRREMQICFDGYSEVLQNIIDTLKTRKKIRAKDYIKQAEELEDMRCRLISAKNQFLNVCAAEVIKDSTKDLKIRLDLLIRSEELRRVLAVGDQEEIKSFENVQNQINGFFNKLDNNAAQGKSLITSYKLRVLFKFHKYPTGTPAEDFKRSIDKCKKSAKVTLNGILNKLLPSRQSLKAFCATLRSERCSYIMHMVYANVLSPTMNLIKVMVNESETEVKDLFKICVDGALLDKTEKVRFRY